MTTRDALVLFSASTLLLLACSSDADDTPTTTKANPCATPNATYVLHPAQQSGGTCGDVPDQVVNISPDGTISTSNVTCETTNQDGCTARNSGCSVTVNGVTCKSTMSVTFAADGASASGILSESCTATGFACSSTYEISATRR